MLRYLGRQQRRERIILQLFTSKFPADLRRGDGHTGRKLWALLGFTLGCLLLPLKWVRSHREACALLKQGVRLADFTALESKAQASLLTSQARASATAD